MSQAFSTTRPVWRGIAAAREAIALADRTLLHAGPPYADPSRVPAPVLSSAVVCALYEGWAASEPEAEAMVRAGAIRLAPAQDHGVVTPLAETISPSTTLLAVSDANDAGRVAFAPLASGPGPQLRFGVRHAELAAKLAFRDGPLATELVRALAAGPIDLLPIAQHAFTAGDELHGRCTAASARLAETVAPRLPADGVALPVLQAMPTFSLTLWMAAAKLLLSMFEGGAERTLVTRIGGNGDTFGVALAGRPGAWTTTAGAPPVGPRMPNAPADAQVVNAIGDSAVIDALGWGAMRIAGCPEALDALRPHLPDDWRDRPGRLLATTHAAPELAGMPLVLDAARVRASGIGPLVSLSLVDAAGRSGLLGRGLYVAPVTPFAHAVDALG